MPFIGDDLLTSFDEDRTLAVLRLLAAAGQRQQIILFTHHRHVVDLAKYKIIKSILLICDQTKAPPRLTFPATRIFAHCDLAFHNS